MLTWLIPISLFWIPVAVYLGGLSVSIEGGNGVREVLGLLVSFVLFLLLWGLMRWLLGQAAEGFIAQILLPTVVALAALPLLIRAAFRIFGVRVGRAAAATH
jgi:hypothetical protein